jgi:ATP-binding cassette, subfamily B, multidrug efflux pump
MKILLRLKSYLLRYKKLYILGFIATLGSNLSANMVPLIIRHSVDTLRYSLNTDAVIKTSLWIVGISLVSGFFLFLTRRTIIVASRKIEYDLRNDFFEHLLKLHLRYFQSKPTGDLMAHATNDINAVRNFLGPAIMYSADTLIAFVLITTIMISINPLLTGLSFIPLPFISIFVYLIGSSVNKKYEAVQAEYSVLTAKAQESLSGIRVVKSFVREDNEIESFEKISKEYMHRNMRLVKVQSLMFPLMVFFIGLSMLTVTWLGGKMVIEDKLTLGDLTAFLIYLGWLIWPMIAFGWVANMVQQSAASMKRISIIMDTEPEVRDSDDSAVIKELLGNIEFKNISFRYDDVLPEVLHNINLKVPTGSTLAIIGNTGSGKTTLVNLVSRLFDTSSGSVEIDGYDVKNIPVDVLRSNIGYVTQETFLFSTSIKENILFGVDGYNEAEFKEACDIAQIDKDVQSFQNKYDTVIGERGITLSGGQKQRVSIARAVLKKPAILILDDALSAVDTYTEEEILRRLTKFMQSRTSIIISHRISTVKNADLIIALEDGKIAESGNHDELLKAEGIYFDLYTKQLLERELDELE